MFKFTSINILRNAVNFIHTALYMRMSRREINKGEQLLLGLSFQIFSYSAFHFHKKFTL